MYISSMYDSAIFFASNVKFISDISSLFYNFSSIFPLVQNFLEPDNLSLWAKSDKEQV